MPRPFRRHLKDRLKEGSITESDIILPTNGARSNPEAPAGAWCKDFGSFKLSGGGAIPKTILTKSQPCKGKQIQEADLAIAPHPCATINPMGQFYTRTELAAQRALWKQQGKKVVFTNGCYDLLHPGHIRLLESARSLGDVLILALNTDASVQKLKGPTRPLIAEQERAELACALQAVDAVTLFDEDTPRELIALILPDVLVKGADWSHFIAGREEVEAAGGKVLPLPLEEGYSSTNIEQEILKRQL